MIKTERKLREAEGRLVDAHNMVLHNYPNDDDKTNVLKDIQRSIGIVELQIQDLKKSWYSRVWKAMTNG